MERADKAVREKQDQDAAIAAKKLADFRSLLEELEKAKKWEKLLKHLEGATSVGMGQSEIAKWEKKCNTEIDKEKERIKALESLEGDLLGRENQSDWKAMNDLVLKAREFGMPDADLSKWTQRARKLQEDSERLTRFSDSLRKLEKEEK